jgi:hypothetical protein
MMADHQATKCTALLNDPSIKVSVCGSFAFVMFPHFELKDHVKDNAGGYLHIDKQVRNIHVDEA